MQHEIPSPYLPIVCSTNLAPDRYPVDIVVADLIEGFLSAIPNLAPISFHLYASNPSDITLAISELISCQDSDGIVDTRSCFTRNAAIIWSS